MIEIGRVGSSVGREVIVMLDELGQSPYIHVDNVRLTADEALEVAAAVRDRRDLSIGRSVHVLVSGAAISLRPGTRDRHSGASYTFAQGDELAELLEQATTVLA